MAHVARAERPGESVVGDPLEVGHGRFHVRARADGGRHEESVLGKAEGVRHPPVPGVCPRIPRLEGVLPVGGVVEEVAQAKVTVVDQLGGHSLAVHVGEPEHGVVQSVPTRAVGLLDFGHPGGRPLGAQHVDGPWIDLVVLTKSGEQVVVAGSRYSDQSSLGIPACESDDTMITLSMCTPPGAT